MNVTNAIQSIFGHYTALFLSECSVFSLWSLIFAFCVAVAFLALRQRRRRGHANPRAIARAIFRKRLMFHPSILADIFFFGINTLSVPISLGWAMFGNGIVARPITGALSSLFGPRLPVEAPEFLLRAGVTLLLFLAYEFGYWLDHYLSHRIDFIWELHRTHHSAEVLTPWTVWRVHPLDSLIFSYFLAMSIGLAMGVANYVLGREVASFDVDGQNILLVICIYAFVHLQHSQFWIPFSGAFGRVLMSPAHHQIHHSMDPRHHNKNFGSCLAVFDMLFGTLEAPPQESPHLVFGVEARGEDPNSVVTMLVKPVCASFAVLAVHAERALGLTLAALKLR